MTIDAHTSPTAGQPDLCHVAALLVIANQQ
jgi:hypothetical protein